MKKTLFICAAVLMLAACATSKLTPEEKAAQKKAKQEEVLNLVKSHHFVVNARVMHSSLSGSKQIDYGYGVTVKGDTLISYLPYVGKTHNLSYGNDEGLNFTGAVTEYRLDRPKADMNRVQMVVASRDNIYLYLMEVYDDGNVQMQVTARNKEAIGFGGEIEAIKE